MGIRIRNKTRIISIVLFLSILTIFVSCHKEKSGWEGKIEYKNGVKVIKNPEEPLCGQIQFELEEDLSIGREDDENYTFYDIIYIVVDNDGNIFILDKGNFRIQKYYKKQKSNNLMYDSQNSLVNQITRCRMKKVNDQYQLS